ncbi:hypothetical protein VYU27_010577, partial [Nannochloropsis oceanica]
AANAAPSSSTSSAHASSPPASLTLPLFESVGGKGGGGRGGREGGRGGRGGYEKVSKVKQDVLEEDAKKVRDFIGALLQEGRLLMGGQSGRAVLLPSSPLSGTADLSPLFSEEVLPHNVRALHDAYQVRLRGEGGGEGGSEGGSARRRCFLDARFVLTFPSAKDDATEEPVIALPPALALPPSLPTHVASSSSGPAHNGGEGGREEGKEGGGGGGGEAHPVTYTPKKSSRPAGPAVTPR